MDVNNTQTKGKLMLAAAILLVVGFSTIGFADAQLQEGEKTVVDGKELEVFCHNFTIGDAGIPYDVCLLEPTSNDSQESEK